jgi:dolichol-phosphate mannosyltransferase
VNTRPSNQEPRWPSISIVVPCFNEEEGIAECHRRLTECLRTLNISYEIVYVDDGSRDATLARLSAIHDSDPNVTVVELSRNFGHQPAVTAGLEAAKAFYRFINLLSEVEIPLDAGDFRLLDRKAVEAMKSMPERHRFIRGMCCWIGFRQCGIKYARAARFAGSTKYPVRKMLNLALDGIASFSTVPLRVVALIGLASAVLALLGIVYALVVRLFTHSWVAGWAISFVVVLFLGGLQMMSIGIVGEYVGRIYTETKHRPLYIARSVLHRRGPGRPLAADQELESVSSQSRT